MSGRNWTRRSIEELVRAYMKKQGGGSSNPTVCFEANGGLYDSVGFGGTPGYGLLGYIANYYLKDVENDLPVYPNGTSLILGSDTKVYGRVNFGFTTSLTAYVLQMDQYDSGKSAFYLYTRPSRNWRGDLPNVTSHSEWSTTFDTLTFDPSDGPSDLWDDAGPSYSKMFRIALGASNKFILIPYDPLTSKVFTAPNYVPTRTNIDTLTTDGAQGVLFSFLNPAITTGALDHCFLTEAKSAYPFDGVGILYFMIIGGSAIASGKKIDDYVKEYCEVTGELDYDNVTYKYQI